MSGPVVTRSSGRRAALGVPSVVLVILGLQAVSACRPAAEDTTIRDPLAVMFFENLSDVADSDRLAVMMTHLLTAELSRATGATVISQQRLQAALLQREEPRLLDRPAAFELAGELSVESLLIGQVTRANDRLSARVEALAAADGRVLRVVEVGDAGNIFDLAQLLGAQVGRILPAAGDRDRPPPALSEELTTSEEAYRAYVEGEVFIHRSDFRKAAEKLREAVRIDPGFAQAHYRLSWATAWYGGFEEALVAVQEAVRLGEDLPPAKRDVFRAAALFFEGNYSECLPLAEAMLVDDPENKEALNILSEGYLHSALHTNVGRAVEALIILDTLDPSFKLLRDHLLLGLTMQGRWPEAEAYVERWTAEDPQMVELRYLGLAMASRGDEVPELPEPFTRILDEYRTAVLLAAGHWDLAREAVSRDPGEGYLRSWNLRYRGDVDAYFGKLEKALAAYREAAETVVSPQLNGIPSAAYLSLADLELLRGDAAAARRMAEAAVRLLPMSPSAHYNAGRIALLDADRAAAAQRLATIRSLKAQSRGTVAGVFERALEAELLLAEGRAQEALRTFSEVVSSGALLEDFLTTDSSSGAAIRDGLARAQRAVWDQRGEIAALEGLVGSGFERLDRPVLYVRALFRLGELHLEAGSESSAREYFGRFLEHWGKADWNLAEVVEAREYLARRSSGSSAR